MTPKIIILGYKDYSIVSKKRLATCGIKITDGDSITSNFISFSQLFNILTSYRYEPCKQKHRKF